MARKQNTLRNFRYGIIAQISQYALSFVTRTVFISVLNVEFLGVNGLFFSIFSVINLIEMGSGSVFVSMLFKPIRNKDEKTISGLMREFDKLYKTLAIISTVIGLSLTPFIGLLVKGTQLPYIHIYYLLYLAGFVSTYLFKPYVQFIIANQDEYIVTSYRNRCIIIQYISQIILLVITRNYLIYLIVQIMSPIAANMFLKIKASNNYTSLKAKSDAPMEQDILYELKKKIKGQFIGNMGTVAAYSTRSMIISTTLGLSVTGIYSNYGLIIQMIDYFIETIFGATSASVGDLIAEGDTQKIYIFFERMMFLAFMICGFAFICLIALLNPFISVWLGSEFLLSQRQVTLAVAAYAIGFMGIRRPVKIFRNTSGLFYKDRYICLLEGISVIILSPVMAHLWGLSGIFIAFLISSCLTFTSNIYVLYKHLFKRPMIDFLKSTYLYFLAVILLCAVAHHAPYVFSPDSWLSFMLMAALCASITAAVLAVSFHKTKEFKYFWKILSSKNSY